jgi:N-acetylglutamate synthase-like GNAT family acetyltransferase
MDRLQEQDMVEEQTAGIVIQRARPSNAERIAAFICQAQPDARPVTREDILAHLGRAGILLAECDGEPVGLLGWQIENLVSRVTDFLIRPARLRLNVGRALLEAMEETSNELQCEATILLTRCTPPPEDLAFWQQFGYELRDVTTLPRPWQEAACEGPIPGERVLVKQLRKDRVLRPI